MKKLENRLEELWRRFYEKTGLTVIATQEEKMLYILGDIEICVEYAYVKANEICQEEKEIVFLEAKNAWKNENMIQKQISHCQAICQLVSVKEWIIIVKQSDSFTTEEKEWIQATLYLAKKMIKEG